MPTTLPTAEVSLSVYGKEHYGPIDSPRSDQYTRSSQAIEANQDYKLGTELLDLLESQGRRIGVTTKRERSRHKDRAHYFDGGLSYSLVDALTAAGGIAAVTALLKAAQPSIVQWLKNRGGHSLKLKIASVQIELQSSDDLDKALTTLQSHSAAIAELAKNAGRKPKAESGSASVVSPNERVPKVRRNPSNVSAGKATARKRKPARGRSN